MDDDNKKYKNSDIDENDSVIGSDDIVSEEDENTPRLIEASEKLRVQEVKNRKI